MSSNEIGERGRIQVREICNRMSYVELEERSQVSNTAGLLPLPLPGFFGRNRFSEIGMCAPGMIFWALLNKSVDLFIIKTLILVLLYYWHSSTYTKGKRSCF